MASADLVKIVPMSLELVESFHRALDHIAALDRREGRSFHPDLVEDEGPHCLDGEGLEDREIFALPSHTIALYEKTGFVREGVARASAGATRG